MPDPRYGIDSPCRPAGHHPDRVVGARPPIGIGMFDDIARDLDRVPTKATG